MKKNLRYIYLAFSISLAIAVYISLLLATNLNDAGSYTQKSEGANAVLKKIDTIRYLMSEAENAQRGFLLTYDSSFLNAFDRNEKIIYPEIEKLRKEIINNSTQKRLLIKLKSIVAERYQVLNHTIDEGIASNEKLFFENNLKGKHIMADFTQMALKMKEEELKELKEFTKKKTQFESATPKYVSLVLAVSIVFLILSLIFIIREFRKRYKYQKELENKINQLNLSHAELEQIAFIASHDLQEPLRKIRTFTGRLLVQHQSELNDEGKLMMSRLEFAAQRMQGLIEDVVAYTNLINSAEQKKKVELETCISEVKSGIANLIQTTNAIIDARGLPEIEAYPLQLKLLFSNLIHNAIKFSKQGEQPVITITASRTVAADIEAAGISLKNEPYLIIKVRDNGIGFENEFARKIFKIFQRLHTQHSAYEGKGIGLAICKRVMTNHNGFIDAEGEPGKGATFNLYFPL